MTISDWFLLPGISVCTKSRFKPWYCLFEAAPLFWEWELSGYTLWSFVLIGIISDLQILACCELQLYNTLWHTFWTSNCMTYELPIIYSLAIMQPTDMINACMLYSSNLMISSILLGVWSCWFANDYPSSACIAVHIYNRSGSSPQYLLASCALLVLPFYREFNKDEIPTVQFVLIALNCQYWLSEKALDHHAT